MPLVLLVDDEPNFLEIISTKLTAVGLQVVVAHTADQAIDAAKKIHPNLILMDIHMPGESGTDAAVAIKQNPATKDIKVAFLSNLKDPWPRTSIERETLAKVIGMDDFIDKTADLDVIAARVKSILNLP
jgi:two-component system cell cycle response regulator